MLDMNNNLIKNVGKAVDRDDALALGDAQSMFVSKLED